MLVSMIASAMAQMKAYSPPEQDIGYEMVATLSMDGMAVVAFDSQLNIVDLQTPVVLQEVSVPSAQVVDAYIVATPTGEVGMTLVAYMWPNKKSECTMNNRSDFYYVDYPLRADTYSFTAARTDII